MTAGRCSLIKADQLCISSLVALSMCHMYWATGHVLCLPLPRCYGPTVSHIQDELCGYSCCWVELVAVAPCAFRIRTQTPSGGVLVVASTPPFCVFTVCEERASLCSSALVSWAGLRGC